MDLTDIKDVETLVEQLQMVIKRKVPIRFGIVPLLTSPAMLDQARAVYYIWDAYGLSAVLAYLELVSAARHAESPQRLLTFVTV